MITALLSLLPFETTPPPSEVDENLVTPGVVGFVVTFLMAAATVLLIIDMTRRIRRNRYREEVRLQLEAEAEAAEGDAGSAGKQPG